MSDAEEEDLRTTSDAIIADTDKLKAMEEQKRALGPDDVERVSLSAEIAGLGRRVAKATEAETEIASEAASDP
jgi:hypothetical protein